MASISKSDVFTIAADPNTDIWKKPPAHNVFTAPYKTHSKHATTAFRSASLTFNAPYHHQYDQAGFLLIFHPPSQPAHAPAALSHRKWIKAGVEVFNGAPSLSVVGCDSWADWSVADVPPAAAAAPLTMRIEREVEASGSCLWIHHVRRQESTGQEVKVPLRQLCWPYGEAAGDGWMLEVAAAVARPSKTTTDSLCATFCDFDVEWHHE
ncbi:hypothetical protein CDD81_3479 [Ophiocordyceps australis]|uniref:Uncharacterized protein n=1 Tax=Ophiocordyceps australis TaxID=1399860 RepID=A0A2C5YDY0_9HYPO|nr:hypothetical protein CDD81_3479 [Ophiocordyceps australis]